MEINKIKKRKKVVDLSFMWGIGRDNKISTDEIMKEIDEGEVGD